MNDYKKKATDEYLRRYPQLGLPIEAGMSKSEAYRDIVLRGKKPADSPDYFKGSPEDRAYKINTPAGEAEILCLAKREDFERAVKCLAYKCEDTEIPPSMGAVTISGIINWDKIHSHKAKYLQSGGTDWKGEFKKFTSVPENYKDRLVIVSKGGYSALTAEDSGYRKETWEKISLKIRIYHELCHIVCRSLFPEKRNAVLDEIVADCFGIRKAVGFYDTALAGKCLGVWDGEYHAGGRLENYLKPEEDPAGYVERTEKIIRRINDFLQETEEKEYWDKLLILEEELFGELEQIIQPGPEKQ